MKKNTKVLLTILICFFAAVFLLCGYKLYTILHQYDQSEKAYNELNNQNVVVHTPSPTIAPGDETPHEPFPISVDFPSLQAQSPDVVGWLYSPDTVINYPVVQGTDNDYYLHRFIDGTYNGNGTLFMDYTLPGDFSGKNSIIYGHHMNDGSMFASICDYASQEYYDAHPLLYLSTPSGNYKVEIFSGYVTNSTSDAYKMSFSGDTDFANHIQKAQERSDFSCSVQVTTADRIITLSTCTYEYENARYVLLGKLVPVE